MFLNRQSALLKVTSQTLDPDKHKRQFPNSIRVKQVVL